MYRKRRLESNKVCIRSHNTITQNWPLFPYGTFTVHKLTGLPAHLRHELNVITVALNDNHADSIYQLSHWSIATFGNANVYSRGSESPSGLAWLLYKCSALWRAVYSPSATERPLGTILEE